MKHQNVIELNGKRYDALSGTLLGVSKASAAIPVAPRSTKGQVIDGFIRHPKTTSAKSTAHPKTMSVRQPIATVKAPQSPLAQAAKPVHQPAKHAKAHTPEHAKTLMRRAVHKPKTALKPAIKVQLTAEIAAKPVSAIAPKRSAYQVDSRRLERAHQVPKHQAVRHFHAPAHTAGALASQSPAVAVHQPVARTFSAATAPRPHVSAAPSHTDIFEAAVARANSHEQPPHKPSGRSRHRRLVNALAGLGAFLVIGGFIAYLNMPNIELRVASFQAGFGAQLPGYTPTGFALRGGVQRTGNTVSLKYQSGNQSYTITQQASDWNSQTLVENTLALSSGEHKTVLAGGRTIYMYGSNAVWVDGNVRYDVTGNAPLSSEDITNLATSL